MCHCPCCGFLADAHGEEQIREELRDHVLWTHYQTDDWGKAPSPFAAAALFFHIGILTKEEVDTVATRAFQNLIPRPNWFASFAPLLAGAALFMGLGVFYGYQWGHYGSWWSPLSGLVALAFLTMMSAFRHQRHWRGHKTQKQLERQLFHVPDHLPDDFGEKKADESR